MPTAIITVAAYFYSHFEKNTYVIKGFEGVKFIIIGMIVAIMLKYFNQSFKNWKVLIFLVLGFGLTYWFNVQPIILVLGAALLALFIL